MSNTDKTLHICYATDDNFADLTCQSIYSIIRRKDPTTEIVFHVLGDRLTNPHIFDVFRNLDHVGIIVTLIDGKQFMQGQLSKVAPAYATYLRFLIPLLPEMKDVKRALWLDGDVFARKDLFNMFHYDLQGYPLGLAKDAVGVMCKGVVPWPEPEYFHRDYYCNCGVILMDLDKLRHSNIIRGWMDAVARVGETQENDQHIVNRLNHYDICLLPPTFNFSYHNLIRIPKPMNRYVGRWNVYYGTHYGSLDEIIRTSYVWHFHEELEDHKKYFPLLKLILESFENDWREFQKTRIVRPWTPEDDKEFYIDCKSWFDTH